MVKEMLLRDTSSRAKLTRANDSVSLVWPLREKVKLLSQIITLGTDHSL